MVRFAMTSNYKVVTETRLSVLMKRTDVILRFK